MTYKWDFVKAEDPGILKCLMASFNVPKSFARVLHNRGLTDVGEVVRFLKPDPTHLHDPFLLKDMDVAVERLIHALREKESILICGDYDVDGITSVALLYQFLKDQGSPVTFYIPDRASEGYGISVSGIEEARRRGCSLIVTVDCGITSVDEIAFANRYGIDVIISDHHEPADQLPQAYAVIDPKRADCGYPFKDLAGVGVAYKLARGVLMRLGMDSTFLDNYLDIVAIGSAADIVPLVGENRVLVKLGLDKLNREGQEGLMTLVETAGLPPGRIDVGRIIYGIAPRINAVGRLGQASPAVELLITRSHMRAVEISTVLEEENQRRKEIDARTLEEALEKIEAEYDPGADSVIVLADENWHPGVIGIVASRIIERYYRPTVMIAIDNGVGKGSARSIPNFDLHAALKSCSDLLQQFGGHKYAAGLTIDPVKIPEFKLRFNEVAGEMLTPDDLTPIIKIDDELALSDITAELIRMIDKLAPFGPANHRPVFITRNLQVVGEPRIVGRNHLKFRVRQDDVILDSIAFNRGEDFNFLKSKRTIDLAYNIEMNTWMDRSNVQLKVKDLR